jgi:chromosome segregation ATPase
MRQNKVSDLIHKSDALPNLDHASVSVHFVEIIDKVDFAVLMFVHLSGPSLSLSSIRIKL